MFGVPLFELESFSVVPCPFAFLEFIGAPEPYQVIFGKPANKFVFLLARNDYELTTDIVAGKFGFPPSAVGIKESLVMIAAESDGVFGGSTLSAKAAFVKDNARMDESMRQILFIGLQC